MQLWNLEFQQRNSWNRMYVESVKCVILSYVHSELYVLLTELYSTCWFYLQEDPSNVLQNMYYNARIEERSSLTYLVYLFLLQTVRLLLLQGLIYLWLYKRFWGASSIYVQQILQVRIDFNLFSVRTTLESARS